MKKVITAFRRFMREPNLINWREWLYQARMNCNDNQYSAQRKLFGIARNFIELAND